MVEMKNSEFPGVPDAVVKHYFRLLAGYIREVKGVLITEKHWSENDEAAMRRLLTDQSDTWHKITMILPLETDQIKLFNAAWRAAINYDEYRFKTSGKGARRKNEAKKLVSDIQKRAEQLSSLLNELSELGYRSVRHPDYNLKQPSLMTEIEELIERAKAFDLDHLHDEEFVNYGISSQEWNSKYEYLRGLVKLMHDAGLTLDEPKEWAGIIPTIANAVLNTDDGGVSYNDVYQVLLDFKKNSNL
jgi:hypothetical protein